MHLLLINPNISDSVSALIEAEARRSASPGTTVEVLTAPFGVAYIETRFEAAELEEVRAWFLAIGDSDVRDAQRRRAEVRFHPCDVDAAAQRGLAGQDETAADQRIESERKERPEQCRRTLFSYPCMIQSSPY